MSLYVIPSYLITHEQFPNVYTQSTVTLYHSVQHTMSYLEFQNLLSGAYPGRYLYIQQQAKYIHPCPHDQGVTGHKTTESNIIIAWSRITAQYCAWPGSITALYNQQNNPVPDQVHHMIWRYGYTDWLVWNLKHKESELKIYNNNNWA